MLLVDAIYEEARKQAQAKIEDALREKEAILEKARREAEALYQDRLKAASEKAKAVRTQILSAAELRSHRESLIFKEGLINEVFDKVRGKLEGMTQQDVYPDVLKRLILEAATGISGRRLTIYMRESDLTMITGDFLQRIIRELEEAGRPGVSLSIQVCDRPISGGCIVASEEGHMIFDNSFERRLERDLPVLRFRVAQMLFGDAGTGAEAGVGTGVQDMG
ncbi:MAG: hypothetical protein HPY71_09965 [Firmicutes bacterium]|nr:hypothetical protein [Bacillota bacterium]